MGLKSVRKSSTKGRNGPREKRTVKRSRFTDEQILRAAASRWRHGGADVCRQMGTSEATFYVWKKTYANLSSTEIRELRSLREENAKLKCRAADLSLDKHILAEIVQKKSEAGA